MEQPFSHYPYPYMAQQPIYQINPLTYSIHTLSSSIQTLSQQIYTHNQEIATLKRNIETLRTDNDSLKEKLQIREEQQKISDDKIQTITNKINTIFRKIKEIKMTFKKEIKEIKQDLDDNGEEGEDMCEENDEKCTCKKENEEDGEDEIIERVNTKNGILIIRGKKDSSTQTMMPMITNMFSSLFNGERIKSETETNDIVDNEEDDIPDFDIYAKPKIIQEVKSDVINITDEIKSIEDLISIGKKYKVNTEIVKQPPSVIGNRPLRAFPSPQLMGTSPLIKQLESQLSESQKSKMKLEADKYTNDFIASLRNSAFDKGTSDFLKSLIVPIPEEDNKTSNYMYNGKKYNMDIEKIVNLVEPLIKLQNTIGMTKIKQQIFDMILYYIQGFETKTSDMLHTSIEGPPGVGKTKIGRILAQIYHGLGIIPSKRFKRVRRTDLIGKYLGHTAHKTQEVIDEAEGGVLFIDEAYSLGSGEEKDIYSKECIDTINMNLTEKKKKLIVIIAGYTNQLEQSFFSVNEGLKRRFPFRFTIDGYDEKELTQIFYSQIKKLRWNLDQELSKEYLEEFFKTNKKDISNFGGDIETIIMNCKMSHASRIIGKPELRKIINISDFTRAFDNFKTNKNKQKEMDESIKQMYL